MTIDPQGHSTPTKPSSRTQRGVIVALVIALLSFAAGGYFLAERAPESTRAAEVAKPAGPAPAGPPQLLERGAPFSFADLVEHVSPAVVTVSVEMSRPREQLQIPDNVPEPFRDFFRQFGPQVPPQAERGQAMGSGFIIDATGYVVTNNHVVADGEKISVKLPDGREFDAHLVGTDGDTDVALLKIDGVNDLPTVAIGDDSKLRVGDWVVAVGNPFGLGGTVTAGIVSSIGRDIGNGPYTDYIQIDAPINRGNSGGPTFDLTGQVVGMNTAIFSPSGGSVGIGFAIPASTMQSVIEQLKSSGSVTRGWLGVQIQSLTPDLAASLGAPDVKGAIVAGVVDGSPAAAAGFQQGDVVLSLNGDEITDSRDMTRRVGGLTPGDKVEFWVLRNGERMAISVAIAKRDLDQLASADVRPNREGPSTQSLGMSLAPLTDALRQRFDLDAGAEGAVVVRVDPNSEAAEKGIAAGQIIAGVGNKEVRAPADVAEGIAEARRAGRESVLLLVVERAGQHFVALKLGKG